MKLFKFITIFFIFFKLSNLSFIKSYKQKNKQLTINVNNYKKYYKIIILKSSKKFNYKYIINKPYLINSTTIEIVEFILDIIYNWN